MTLTGKVLVVDDHLHLAENLAEILESAGYETAVAGSAEAALVRLREGDVGAIVTDYRLPGLTGAQLIAELRRQGSDIPALVMSAFTDDATIQTSRSVGALEVLAKPVEIGRLLALVQELGSGGSLVLVVDDNQALAENFGEALRGQGFDVRLTGSVAEALAAGEAPQAAIVDYRLPDGTGVDLAEALTERHPHLRVLFVSAHSAELELRLRGRLAESARFEKPVDLGRLLEWVQAAVGHGKAKRPGR